MENNGDIWEVQLMSQPVWVSAETYQVVKTEMEHAKTLNRDEYLSATVAFNSIIGVEFFVLTHSIVGLMHSTSEQRTKMRDIMMQFQSEQYGSIGVMMGQNREAQPS